MGDYGKSKMYMFGKGNGCVQCRHGNYVRTFDAAYKL